MKVRESNFQYQLDPDGNHWIFRYDYIRESDEAIPAAHFQLRGSLLEDCLPEGKPLHKIHFPTMRVSLEAVIRLLAVEFDVPCNENKEIWIPALETTESAFFDIQHLPVALAPSKTPRKKPRKK